MSAFNFSEEEIVDGIENGDPRVLEDVYSNLYPAMEKLFAQLGRGLNLRNAKIVSPDDLLQETITAVYYNIAVRKKYKIEGKFFGYCTTIAWWLMNKERKRFARHPTIEFVESRAKKEYIPSELSQESLTNIGELKNDCMKLFDEAFEKLGDRCKNIFLRYTLKNKKEKRLKQLAEEYGVKENHMKQIHSRCKKKFERLVKQHPDFKYVFGDIK